MVWGTNGFLQIRDVADRWTETRDNVVQVVVVALGSVHDDSMNSGKPVEVRVDSDAGICPIVVVQNR